MLAAYRSTIRAAGIPVTAFGVASARGGEELPDGSAEAGAPLCRSLSVVKRGVRLRLLAAHSSGLLSVPGAYLSPVWPGTGNSRATWSSSPGCSQNPTSG